jgi:hypothetical protein
MVVLQPPSRPSTWELLKDILDRQGAALAIAGLAVYVMVHSAYEALYGDLELTPEEIGVTYVSIVTRAGLGLVRYLILILLLAAGLGLLVGFFRGTYPSISELLPDNERLRSLVYLLLIFGFVLAFCGYFAWTILQDFFGRLSTPDRIIYSVLLVAAVLATLGDIYVLLSVLINPQIRSVDASGKWKRQLRLFLNKVPRRAAFLITLLVILASLIVLSNLASRWGHYKAQVIRAGQTLQPSPLYALLDLRARKICITWIGNDPTPLDTTRPFMYLGRGQDTIILYDYYWSDERQQRPRRIPASNVLLRGLGDDKACKNDAGTPGSVTGSSGPGGATSNSGSSTSTSVSCTCLYCNCPTTTAAKSCPCTTTTKKHIAEPGPDSSNGDGKGPGDVTGFNYLEWILLSVVLIVLGGAALRASRR